MRVQLQWILAGIAASTLGLSVASSQETGQSPAGEAAAKPDAAQVDGAPAASVHTESIGPKTGLKIFVRDEDKASEKSAKEEPIATIGEEPMDWLGALAAIWNEWRESDSRREHTSRMADNPRLFANRQFIRQHDKDKSGDLSRDEIPAKMSDAFDKLDADHNGKLTATELRRHMRQDDDESSEPATRQTAYRLFGRRR